MNPDGVFRARVPILLLLVMAGFLIASFGYRPEARSLPVLVAGVTIGLLLLEILVQTGTTAGRRNRAIVRRPARRCSAGRIGTDDEGPAVCDRLARISAGNAAARRYAASGTRLRFSVAEGGGPQVGAASADNGGRGHGVCMGTLRMGFVLRALSRCADRIIEMEINNE